MAQNVMELSREENQQQTPVSVTYVIKNFLIIIIIIIFCGYDEPSFIKMYASGQSFNTIFRVSACKDVMYPCCIFCCFESYFSDET